MTQRHHFDPYRGYGPGAVTMLRRFRAGEPWAAAAGDAFGGQGSAGNGAAMRSAPLGAWHADSLVAAARAGERAAVVTHAHPDGVAGAVAVTVAAAAATAGRATGARPDLLGAAVAHTPPGPVRDALTAARMITGYEVFRRRGVRPARRCPSGCPSPGKTGGHVRAQVRKWTY